MELASNVARRDTFNRKGKNSYVPYSFEEYSKYCDKLIPQYCTWYSYEKEPLYAYIENNYWSISGYHATKPKLYFDFIPFDFDSDSIEQSLENVKKFVSWLEKRGIPESHYNVWLSGSKGFHVEVDRVSFSIEHPSVDILRRVKQFVERLQKILNIPDKELDKTLYSTGRLYRVPNSKHAKTGLHKVKIPVNKLDKSFIDTRFQWANSPTDSYNNFTHGNLKELIELPDVELEHKEFKLSANSPIDTSLSIISKCPRIQYIMLNPQNRDLRRQAVGVLMEAYGESDADEVNKVFEAFANHPYMNEARLADAEKWRKEFDKDGHIKCGKTCTSFGCSSEQKKICGTKMPSDHLVTAASIKPISVDEARKLLDSKMEEAFKDDSNDVWAFDAPIGLGKTTKLLEKMAADYSQTGLCLCPTHDLAKQVHDDAVKLGIESRHIMSRTKLYEKIQFECPYITELKAMQSNNATNATRAVCSKCPRFPGNIKEDEAECEYFFQYRDIEKIRFVVGVHAHANEYTYEKIGISNRSFVAVDESPIKTFSGLISRVPIEIQAVMQQYNKTVLDELIEETNELSVEPPEFNDFDDGSIFAAVRCIYAREEHLAEMEDYANKKKSLDELKVVRRFIFTLISNVIAGNQPDISSLTIALQINYYQYLKKYIEKIVEKTMWPDAMKLKEGFRHIIFPDIISNAAKCIIDLGQPYSMNDDYFFPTRMPENKIIILDATADKTLYERLIQATNTENRRLNYFKLPFVEQTHAKITQITNSGYSKTRISTGEGTMDSLLYVLKTVRSTNPLANILCVSVLELKGELTKDLDVDTGHYGALRGRNEFENHDWEIVLGGYFTSNIAVIESLNRLGIYGVTNEVLEAATITLRTKHVAKNGDTYFSQRKTFKSNGKRDALAYASLIFEQAAISEIVQSVRIRLFSGNKDKNVILLTNVGLSTIYADRFMTLQELTAELEDISGLKSELDTTVVRRNDLIVAKFTRLSIDDTFAPADLSDNDSAARKFIRACQSVGLVCKVGKSKYRKLAELGDESPVEQRETKQSVFLKMSAWLSTLSDYAEFTVSDLADAVNCTSPYYIKEWIKEKEGESSIVRIGQARSTRYRKIKSITSLMAGLV